MKIEDRVDNFYLKKMIGVLTRTYFLNSGEYSEKNSVLDRIYISDPSYFDNKHDRRGGIESWPMDADTMIGVYRLVNIYESLKKCIDEGIEGDFVETGIWKGGACVFANAVMHEFDQQNARRVHCFDSFEGLPAPYMEEDEGDQHYTFDFLRISVDQVKEVFSKYKLLTENAIFRKGFFKDSMKEVEDIEKICMLRLDGDMYSSTIEVLEALYDKVSIGGFVVVDDWILPTARAAVYDFLNSRGISPEFRIIDESSIYWIK
jgi:O-methyltransferase